MEEEQRIRDRCFEYWKTKRTVMYNKIINHFLEWPCHTVEWLPDESDLGGIGYRSGKKIHDSYLNSTVIPCRWKVLRKIIHEGVVKCVRHMPQNTSYIATKTVSGEVHIFDHVKHPLEPTPDSVLSEQEGPDLRLLGHRTNVNVYGLSHDKLSWSKLKKGYLLSGADDSQIFVWDINASPNNVALWSTPRGHNGGVQDVAWHVKNEHLLGSVGSDKYLSIWDLRQSIQNNPVQSVEAHRDEVTSLSFNPFDEWTLATGSADKMVKVFDLRNIYRARYRFTDHRKVVNQVEWSPKNRNLLASFCADRKVHQKLLFVHTGHKRAIKEFSWDPNGDWDIASVAEGNDLQTWKMTNDYDQGRQLSGT
ncbi:hypothetical protein Patl1_06974 [Pistacia atlantica]|uniref:Uncharacterized protein n=1 Tax=Pistacia atlantica TaxID=434234 RepID=A0ACC1AG42_9ROSI|nr:hypothetical protein Patl1_06974 [Pistacia atlantica]